MHVTINIYLIVIAALIVWTFTARYILWFMAYFMPPVIMVLIIAIYSVFNSRAIYSVKIKLPK